MKFIAEKISRNSYVNIMAQYRPAWKVVTEGGRARYSRHCSVR